MNGPRFRMLAFALTGLLVMTRPVFAAEPAEQVTAAVEQSGVSRQDREALLQEADRALMAGVPAADLEIIVRRSTDRGLTPSQVRDLIRATTQAGELGLSVRTVLDRIQQGLAKGAPAERIISASRRLVETLAAAGPLVDELAARGLRASFPEDRAYAVETVARAFERSVPDTMVRDIGEAALKHGATMVQFDRAVRSLTLLSGIGMPIDRAGSMMRETIEHRFTDRDYGRLERRVSDMLEHSRSMEEIVNTVEHEIRSIRRTNDRRDTGIRDRGPDAGREPVGRGARGR